MARGEPVVKAVVVVAITASAIRRVGAKSGVCCHTPPSLQRRSSSGDHSGWRGRSSRMNKAWHVLSALAEKWLDART
jgi:hypothetical protein